jgi:hypothetical protein
MAKSFTINVTQQSLSSTIRSFEQFEQRVTDRIGRALGETGFMIQRDAKRGAPVRYGVLWSSIYVDWKRRVQRQISVSPGAPLAPTYPGPQSLNNGMDVIIGSIVEYAPTMEAHHPTKAGFFSSAVDYHESRVQAAIDNIIERETRR